MYFICTACPSGSSYEFEGNFWLAKVKAHNARKPDGRDTSITARTLRFREEMGERFSPHYDGNYYVEVIKMQEGEDPEDLFAEFKRRAHDKAAAGTILVT